MASDKILVNCRQCVRLHNQLKQLRKSHPDYWNLPVASSGDEDAALMIVGLAPGKHGANKTGVPFTGDASGELLFRVLTDLGIQDKIRITNAVKCLPIDNKPIAIELNNCQKFLVPEINHHFSMAGPRVLLALGQIAHRSVLKSLDRRQKSSPFQHAAQYQLTARHWLVSSYHCSRYNIQTGRLTEAMFQSVVKSAAELAGYL